MNNTTQASRYWYSGNEYDENYALSSNYRRMHTLSQFRLPASQPRPDPNRGGSRAPWRPAIEERAIAVPRNLAGFSRQPASPMQVVFLNTGVAREQPAVLQRNLQAATSTQAAGDRATIAAKERASETEDDGQRCAVCLEDFEPRESVMLTPCNHMFHEECIVPWVKSNGKCPVCRFVLCDHAGGSAAPPAQNIASFAGNDTFEGELVSLVRAMEEAFRQGNTDRRW
ncbi:ANAPHASE-PROMOTING COMPLEX SUBUNIT 11 RING-H2 FINGER PROTEIN [Salix koriyanagi]|uniref:ANAPHASE-PROMOTING COMPLEX SUBUNIT 11 RING-H2 FINGER PROTEIN n=1 Tax=Salix koriyanagi TaxID=2511006 RepID=A0A9Q0Z6W4_9ROSI|nr:ANAPHASE-PROMOTING COMPLEX SUBUNIT 11 RING-H2 FINGER PROTEIN [Salix koriyanagi]